MLYFNLKILQNLNPVRYPLLSHVFIIFLSRCQQVLVKNIVLDFARMHQVYTEPWWGEREIFVCQKNMVIMPRKKILVLPLSSFLEMEFATLQRPSYEDLERRRRMREGSPSPVKGSSGSRGLQRKGKNKVTVIKKS